MTSVTAGSAALWARDSPLLAFTDPPLTTLHRDVVGMVRRAVEALLDEVSGTPTRRELLFRIQLVVRRSTAPPRA